MNERKTQFKGKNAPLFIVAEISYCFLLNSGWTKNVISPSLNIYIFFLMTTFLNHPLGVNF